MDGGCAQVVVMVMLAEGVGVGIRLWSCGVVGKGVGGWIRMASASARSFARLVPSAAFIGCAGHGPGGRRGLRRRADNKRAARTPLMFQNEAHVGENDGDNRCCYVNSDHLLP